MAALAVKASRPLFVFVLSDAVLVVDVCSRPPHDLLSMATSSVQTGQERVGSRLIRISRKATGSL